jgi:hypothetical protein
MADQDDVRRIALSLPETSEAADGFAFTVRAGTKEKAFAWVWLERQAPAGPRRPNPGVLAVRVTGEDEKRALIAAGPTVFFTEPHYDGWPAVLIRLDAIDRDELREVLTDAWRIQAPRRLVRAYDDPPA